MFVVVSGLSLEIIGSVVILLSGTIVAVRLLNLVVAPFVWTAN
jgi:hypothetical protein